MSSTVFIRDPARGSPDQRVEIDLSTATFLILRGLVVLHYPGWEDVEFRLVDPSSGRSGFDLASLARDVLLSTKGVKDGSVLTVHYLE